MSLREILTTERYNDDELFAESPAAVAEEERQFAMIKELLTAEALGTS